MRAKKNFLQVVFLAPEKTLQPTIQTNGLQRFAQNCGPGAKGISLVPHSTAEKAREWGTEIYSKTESDLAVEAQEVVPIHSGAGSG